MPFLANDRLDPERSHGDVLLSIEAGHARHRAVRAAPAHARAPGATLVLQLDGRGLHPAQRTEPARGGRRATCSASRTAPPTSTRATPTLMDQLRVGRRRRRRARVGRRAARYHVVRIIRMFVEFWDRTPLGEQEALIGRHKVQRRAARRHSENDDPRLRRRSRRRAYPARRPHPAGQPAHRRRPTRTGSCAAGSQLLARLRRRGRLDQGLAFVCFQRSLEKGFLTVQAPADRRAARGVHPAGGGGFFFALPGVPSPARFLGDTMVGG